MIDHAHDVGSPSALPRCPPPDPSLDLPTVAGPPADRIPLDGRSFPKGGGAWLTP